MLNADRAVGQDVGAVDHCTIEVIVALVGSELLKHLYLVDDCVDQVLILHIGCIVGVQLDGAVEGLFRLGYLAERQVRLEESLVDSCERVTKSDPGLAVFDGLSVHF